MIELETLKQMSFTRVFAIADLHLSFSCPQKNMAKLSEDWKDYQERLEENWDRMVGSNDLVLIPGDITWAMKLEDADKDLQWLDARPGIKLVSKGNHDYWWPSLKKANGLGLKRTRLLFKQAIELKEIFIVAARMWDDPDLDFDPWIAWKGERAKIEPAHFNMERLQKEQSSLERTLQDLDTFDQERKKTRLAMLHYPPTDARMISTTTTRLLQRYRVQDVVFGHLHSLKRDFPGFQHALVDGLRCHFVAADWLQFKPLELFNK